MNFVNMMMNMDPRMMGMMTPLSSPALGTHPQQGLQQENAVEFSSLLDLVSDLEIAEASDPQVSASVEEVLAAMKGRDGQQIEFAKHEAKSLMELPTVNLDPGPLMQMGSMAQEENRSKEVLPKDIPELLSVGRRPELTQLGAETRLEQDLSLEGMKIQTQRSKEAQWIPDSESVAQWSAALASGDIQAVSLEKAPKTVDPRIFARDAWNPLEKPITPEHLQAKELLQEKEPLQSKQHIALTKVSTLRLDGAEPEVPRPKQTPVPEAVSAKAEFRQEPLSVRPVEPKAEVRRAQDFMLEQAPDMNFSLHPSLAPAATQESAVLRAAQDLGMPHDPRISAQAVDFVAQKVEALQAQGGGTLRIDMAGSELGGMTLRVAKRLGQVEVSISAERADTTALLESAKSELSAKLQAKVGPSAVDVRMSGPAETSTPSAWARSESVAPSSTEQMLSLRHAGLSGEVSAAPQRGEGRLEVSASSSHQTSKQMGSEGWQREERRGRAMDQWEEQVLRQKSA